MLTASLIVNIAVLVPVCIALFMNAEKVQKSAGPFTPARGVLLAMYLTILFTSILLLFSTDSKLAFTLLFMQVVYKSLSPFTVKTIKNPIVISNLFIAAFHLITIFTMFKSGALVLDIV